jgi:hypothetical protein
VTTTEGVIKMNKREELRRNMNRMQGMVSNETREKLANSMQVQAAKKKFERALNDKNGVEKDMLIGAIRKMMDE